MRKEFGTVLREIREQRGLTQQQVADRLGIAKGNISRYESGKQSPEFDRLYDLAEALNTSVPAMIATAEADNIDTSPNIKGTVPLISWVQAGNWEEAIDNLHPGAGERVATTYRARRHTYALRVRGDSMEPKFPDGAILVVEPEDNPQPGAYVIVRQNGSEATFKQLVVEGSTTYLKPLNPRYPILELKPDAVFCGVVKRVEMDV